MIGRRIFLALGTFLLITSVFRSCGAIGGSFPSQPVREVLPVMAIAGVGFMIAAVAMAIVEYGEARQPKSGHEEKHS
ncbi:hypothetical protein AB0K18_22860 [Nonomuraea sp. NPDC049421]|uniref:hypothetical protein n=1 Tax=Nonomuraea sp. NPDC049421 TaxID=3155275 RepID=UPI003440EE55